MKNTITALSIAAVVLTVSMITLFMNGVNSQAAIVISIATTLLMQTALSRTEKFTELYQAAGIVISSLVTSIIDSILHEEKALIFCFCSVMLGLASIWYFSFKSYLAKLDPKKAIAEAEALDYQEIAAMEAPMPQPIIKKEVTEKVDRRYVSA